MSKINETFYSCNQIIFINIGGPVIAYEDKAFDDKFGRFILVGIIHGAFSDCSNDLPGIFVQMDDLSVLDFLYKETFGSGLSHSIYLHHSGLF